MTEQRISISNPGGFGKVAVVYGGLSAERDISLMTGAAVLAALQEKSIDAHGIDAGRSLVEELRAGGYDRVWIALHGRGGEDGSLQGALQVLGIPYTGSGVLGSALAMDKIRNKSLLQGVGLPTPPFRDLVDTSSLDGLVAELGLPLAIKPASEGSSLGMTRVVSENELPAALELAKKHSEGVIAEPWLAGAEYTVGVLQGEALPAIRIETPRDFYDYEAKYFSDSTRYFCPAGLSDDDEHRYRALCVDAFRATGLEGWGRVDFLLDDDGNAQIIDINTVPGMTGHSLVPMAAAENGIDFAELCWRILETSFIDRDLGDRDPRMDGDD